MLGLIVRLNGQIDGSNIAFALHVCITRMKRKLYAAIRKAKRGGCKADLEAYNPSGKGAVSGC